MGPFTGADLPSSPRTETPPLGDRYVTGLRQQAEGLNGETKSAKTKAKIKLAAIHCLSNGDLASLTIASVTTAAGVASGTFYLHFDGIRGLVLEVFSEFAAKDIAPAIPHGEAFSDLFTQMKATFIELVASFRRWRFFFRSFSQLRMQDAEVNAIWLRLTSQWVEDLATSARRHAPSPLGGTYRYFLGHASSAYVDEILVRIYCDEIFGPDFVDPVNDECVAELLAFTRHRMLFGVDPDPGLLAFADKDDLSAAFRGANADRR